MTEKCENTPKISEIFVNIPENTLKISEFFEKCIISSVTFPITISPESAKKNFS